MPKFLLKACEDKREIVISEILPSMETKIFNKVSIPNLDASVNGKEFEKFAISLGREILNKSPLLGKLIND